MGPCSLHIVGSVYPPRLHHPDTPHSICKQAHSHRSNTSLQGHDSHDLWWRIWFHSVGWDPLKRKRKTSSQKYWPQGKYHPVSGLQLNLNCHWCTCWHPCQIIWHGQDLFCSSIIYISITLLRHSNVQGGGEGIGIHPHGLTNLSFSGILIAIKLAILQVA